MNTLQPHIATHIKRIVKCRRKPGLYVSKTGEIDNFHPYTDKYDMGIKCPLNMADIHKLSHEMNEDVLECVLNTPEYLVSLSSFNYNDELCDLHILYTPHGLLGLHTSIAIPTIPGINP